MDASTAQADDDLLSVSEAARVAGVHPNTMRRYIHSGEVPASRTRGGHFRVRRADARPTAVEQRPSTPDAVGA